VSTHTELAFMDGPFSLEVQKGAGHDMLEVSAIRPARHACSVGVTGAAFGQQLLAAARSVVAFCEEHELHDDDVAMLRRTFMQIASRFGSM
jgi:hypothetical protein